MTQKAPNLSRRQIIHRMRDILEPWVAEIDSIGTLSERTNLLSDLGLDSTAILQTILAIEKHFGISIPNSQLDSENFSMMAGLVDLIQERLNENN